MIHLIIYDISSNTIRTKIAKQLVAEGYERIQLSVFVGNPHPKQNVLFWKNLNTWLKAEPTAQFCVIRVASLNFKNMTLIGKNKLDLAFLLGKKNSIFI
jgi:CRISPR-associated endonuclease Cas2